MNNAKIITLYSADQIPRNDSADRQRAVNEVKYRMCLGLAERLSARGALSPEECARLRDILRKKYLPEGIYSLV